MIAGFTIEEDGELTVLIRGIGPSLPGIPAGQRLADPRLEVFHGRNRIAENDDWVGVQRAAIEANSQRAGAFPLAPSLDAALLLTLPERTPSNYEADPATQARA